MAKREEASAETPELAQTAALMQASRAVRTGVSAVVPTLVLQAAARAPDSGVVLRTADTVATQGGSYKQDTGCCLRLLKLAAAATTMNLSTMVD